MNENGVPEFEECDNIIYVDKDSTCVNNCGGTWGAAFQDLREALVVALSPPLPATEIWVAEGTYTPTPDLSCSGRDCSFPVRNEVAVYGGFAGGETKLTERDLVTNVTILSGDIGTPGDPSDNSYHVLTTEPTDIYTQFRTILDGFTIVGGNADGTGDSTSDNGGGMYNLAANLTVRNCSFIENQAAASGGAVYDNATSKYINCVFSGNTAPSGGGLYNANGDTKLVNCTFNGNGPSSGKDLYVNAGAPIVVNSIFWSDPASGIFPATLAITYSDVKGGWDGDGNIDVDPSFVNPANNDLRLTGSVNPSGPSPIDHGDNLALRPPFIDRSGHARAMDDANTDPNGTCTGGYGCPDDVVDMGAI